MDLAAKLLERLESPEYTLRVLHLVVQNWIVFQRDSFDVFDEEGYPFATQIFLIELSTGKYIHRALGRKMDSGSALDPDILCSKLNEAFVESRVCQGYPLKCRTKGRSNAYIQMFPFKRRVFPTCQYLFKPKENTTAPDGEDFFRWICPSCRALWKKENNVQDLMHDREKSARTLEEEMDFFLPSTKKDVENQDDSMLSLGYHDDDQESILPSKTQGVGLFSRKRKSNFSGEKSEVERTVEENLNFFEVNGMKVEDILKSDTELFLPLEEDSYLDDMETKESDLETNDVPDRLPPRKQGLKTQKNSEPKKKINEAEHDKKTYPCKHCGKTFLTARAFLKHQRKKREVTCKECGKSVVTFKELIHHVSKAHPKVASKYLKYGQSKSELKTMQIPKRCSLCDMFCNGNALIYRHREFFHELGNYKCLTCQQPCLTYYDLVIHNYQKHDKALKPIELSTHGLKAVSLPGGKIEFKRESYACEHCPTTYITDGSWIMHMKLKHSWGLFECKSCDEICHYVSDIVAHVLTFHCDSPEVPCPTPTCSLVFNIKENPEKFDSHFTECQKAKRKSEVSVFQCESCGREFSSKSTFDDHIKQHQGIERFKCSQCEFGSNIKMIVIDHEKTHLRNRGLTNADTNLILYYPCNQCGKEYATKQGLRDHIKRIHHAIKMIWECKDCGEAFKTRQILYKHKRKEHGFREVRPMRPGRRKKKADQIQTIFLDT